MILDDIKSKAEVNGVVLWFDYIIEVVHGNFAPFIRQIDVQINVQNISKILCFRPYEIVVGDIWLSNEQWAELFALRFRNEIEFRRDKNDRLFIVEIKPDIVVHNNINVDYGSKSSKSFGNLLELQNYI